MNGLSVSTRTSVAVGIKASIPVLTNQTQRERSLLSGSPGSRGGASGSRRQWRPGSMRRTEAAGGVAPAPHRTRLGSRSHQEEGENEDQANDPNALALEHRLSKRGERGHQSGPWLRGRGARAVPQPRIRLAERAGCRTRKSPGSVSNVDERTGPGCQTQVTMLIQKRMKRRSASCRVLGRRFVMSGAFVRRET